MTPLTDAAYGVLRAVEQVPARRPGTELVASIQREPLTAVLLAEAIPLLAAHWREVAHYRDIPLDVDEAAYLAAEQSGLARCYTVRDDWRLVGYAIYFVRANLHYKQSVQAVQDVLYLDPAYRGKTGGLFIAWCDRQLHAEGVQAVYHHVKVAHNFGPLLERMGYEPVDVIYGKRLDDRFDGCVVAGGS